MFKRFSFLNVRSSNRTNLKKSATSLAAARGPRCVVEGIRRIFLRKQSCTTISEHGRVRAS